jgi:hypothetical protein
MPDEPINELRVGDLVLVSPSQLYADLGAYEPMQIVTAPTPDSDRFCWAIPLFLPNAQYRQYCLHVRGVQRVTIE